ncbi:MAG: Glucose--fructose oxidoreductase precursor [Syntrophus sp. PtaB.Bin138]|nr:MAG: Glucose--fructose oxidoreductase precursor [Syntrophus sp. PtaB.Bin138]
MLQLTQKMKNGAMEVLEVPIPVLTRGCVLVRNHFSLISAGTEGSTVRAARSGYLAKAMERPQQVKQVIDTLKTQGVVQTYRAIMKKLDAWSALGYSSAGSVIETAPDVTAFSVGDPVACAGVGYANHAEIVTVPEKLCVKLSPDADLKQASYNTLGAIALQGVRQADLRLGESCAVIGLGLVGQLTCLLLKAAGIRVIGIDIDPAMVEIAAKHCADLALPREAEGIDGRIAQFTGGLGCDAVIITAGTDSLDPINFAGALAHKKGTVVVVGAVPTGFDRDPHFYRKELQVRMSCSYGPGRYDPNYEEKGIDYPSDYVRWTENRNMQAFQELISSHKIDVSYLTTHVFKLKDAPGAYDMMMKKSESHIGILIEYDASKDWKAPLARIDLKPIAANGSTGLVSIGFIGAGSYAQSHLLPNIPKGSDVVLRGVMTASGTGSRSVGERYGFEFCTGEEQNILSDGRINTVFIATRHDSHAGYVLKALRAGKHVFVEKPLCLGETELEEIRSLYESAAGAPPLLMVGYNRRFSPFAREARKVFGTGPLAMIFRANAGPIPKDSWIQDRETGGGRIIGEVCHFVDFLTFLNGSMPMKVHAAAMRSPGDLPDTLNVSLAYENGSIGTIAYLANGDKALPKERVEVYGHGCTAVIDDFKTMSVYAGGKKREKKLLGQDKGQKPEIEAFIDAVRKGTACPIPFEEIYSTSMATFKIMESIQTGNSLRIPRRQGME